MKTFYICMQITPLPTSRKTTIARAIKKQLTSDFARMKIGGSRPIVNLKF